MKTVKKLSLLALSAIMALSIGGCAKKDDVEEQKKFDEFMNQEFVNSLQESYVNTHILTEHPESFGIDVSKLTVEIDKPQTEETMKENKEITEKTANEFHEFDRDLLTDEQKVTYDKYKFMMDYTLEMNDSKYDYMATPLESITGMHTQLPTLFADFTLRNEQDVEDVITLMGSVRTYMNSILDYTKKQEEKGTLMIDIDSIKEYCEKVVKEDVNSSVLTGLNQSIDDLNLGDEKTTQYKEELKKAFQEEFLPTYSDIVNVMEALDTAKNNTQGLSHMKNGKDYYELLFKQAIGTDKSIKEIQKELKTLADASLKTAQNTLMDDMELAKDYMNGNMKTSYTDFQNMLKDLNNAIKDDFPSVGDLDYNIQPIGEDLASGGVAAYFNIPALDSTEKKQIRVNMMKDALDIQSLETFSTLAHEGIPGHMYQIAYEYQNTKDNWSKSIANFLGYTEGYATYVELYSLKYLKDVSKNTVTLQQNLTAYQNCIVALSDIGIHYEGWSEEETKEFLSDNGLEVPDISNFYKQIQSNPTAFLSYYVGYAQIADLKNEVQDELKDKYSDLGFHTALLKSGGAPFSVVEENIEEYIDDTK